MQHSTVEQIARVCPPFRWRLTAWLAGSPYAAPAVQSELRDSLFNRMSSLLTSAVMIFGVALAIAIHHPGLPFTAWAVLDGTCSAIRLVLVLVILRHRARHPDQAAPANGIPDLYVLSGLLWCASLGYGAGVCVSAGDAAISALGALLAMATMGAQCGRVPGAPRLVVVQFLLISLPVCIGGWLAPDPFIRIAVIAAPAYLVAMAGINRQLHRDFVELVGGRQESRQMALRCALTGLPNRRMFDRALADALAGRRGSGPVHVLCLDLDGFKEVNDARGHPTGDMLLKHVAARMLSLVPPESLTARIGGDEFAILVRAGGAEALARRLVTALQEPFALPGQGPVQIGVSIGIACATVGAATPDLLFSQADQALYAAKRSGKNTWRWFGETAGQEDALALLRPVRPATSSPVSHPAHEEPLRLRPAG